MGRRLPGHDYRAKCIYHITMTKAPEAPIFGHLTGGVTSPKIKYSAAGLTIFRHLHYLPTLSPHIRLTQYQIMPDHIHLLIFVTARLDSHLGNYIGHWKNRLNKEAAVLLSSPPLFSENFHDRIIFPDQDLGTILEYIRKNPYRLAVRHATPDYFRRIRSYNISGHDYQLYGNPFLLRNPFKSAVIVHSRYSEAERAAHREKWLHTAENGGVLVSPFISKMEKAILQEALETGGRVIRIQNTPFPSDRFKPSGREFDLCVRGQLLLIAPFPHNGNQNSPISSIKAQYSPFLPSGIIPSEKVTRGECKSMNALAEAIAAGL
ncbi:MAG: hypothetical protein K2O24_09395 [Muribaculaceae bacterium]|nr:hypothetical protein [Muribaculaceae bacterium]